ncbi:MAG TPA: hypothetical protein VJQ52_07165 [Steroidobacteraceae bacterium]|nr:hypothetical protein [Steroidobacteraceae bacterium]
MLALQHRQRTLLLLHIEGLSYREIAAKHALPHELVLRELVQAYCQLRRRLPG